MAQHHQEEREPRTMPEGACAAVERVRESIELLLAEMITPVIPARAAARRVEGMVGVITGEIVDRERIAWVQGECRMQNAACSMQSRAKLETRNWKLNMETIDGQCPCGQPLVAMIFRPRRAGEPPCVRFYAVETDGRRRRARRCPTCDRDFSAITAEQLKEHAWPT